MKTKKSVYITPHTSVIKMHSEGFMAALSLGHSEDPAHGGGHAKEQPDFYEDNSDKGTSWHAWDD